jgi:DnaJ-class molecular chaperone
MKFHPDHNSETPEAEKRFKQIQLSYEILANPLKKLEGI